MRVAVTGARGRLGSALIAALEDAPFTGPSGPIAWPRPVFDLDQLTIELAGALLDRDRPEVVVHAAAWTDVDGCARDPQLAMRRNATATAALATACVRRGVDLVLISTNEVFDGRRTDGRGYPTDEPLRPINPYGASKAEGEMSATAAYAGAALAEYSGAAPGAYPGALPDGHPGARSAAHPGATPAAHPGATPAARLGIVRTAWLYGPPGNDFPARIAAAALRARAAGEPLRAVGDEVGSPTYAPDLAEAIVEILGADAIAPGDERMGIHHLVNQGRASRADWAREVLRATRIEVDVVEVPSATWQRASTPPRWAILEPTPLPSGAPMRDWRDAFADAVPALLRSLPAG